MKFRKKSEVIEAVKWDGNIETIQSNSWLEDAIKENKAMLAMNDIYDKEPTLLIPYTNGSELMVVKVDNYILKREYEGSYIMDSLSVDIFEKCYEAVEDNKSTNNNCLTTTLELNAEEFKHDLNEAKKELEDVLQLIDKVKDKDNFKVITKDIFIANSIEQMTIENIERAWSTLSKGYNFALYKEASNGQSGYYSVGKVDELFKR
ncbi:MAG: hypothetical protein ACRCW0_06760 [Clostridium sp.]